MKIHIPDRTKIFRKKIKIPEMVSIWVNTKYFSLNFFKIHMTT